jgi:GAF domain-containing protein
VEGFNNVGRDVLRTADGRWLEIRRIPTDRLEVVVLYADITTAREAELELAKGSQWLGRQLAGQTLLQETIEVATTVKSFESGVQRVNDLVCEWSGWPVACAYRVSPDDPDRLVPMGLWHLSDPEPFTFLRASTDQGSERKGEGVSGRVLQTKDLVWVANVAVDPSVSAERRAEMPGIRGACALPITSAGRVVAVLEFLAREQLVPDPDSTELLRAVGLALGQVFTHRGI